MVALFRDSGQSGPADLDSRRKMAQMLQSMQPNQAALASNSPLLAAAVPIIQALMAKKMERKIQGEQDALKATREQDMQDMLAAYRGTPEQTVMPQNIDTAEGGDIPPPSVIPAKLGGRKALVEAMLGARSPEYRNAGLQALVGTSQTGQPSSVQEWGYYNSLPKEDQARFLEMKRNPNIMNLGGEFAVRAPSGGVGERYKVTPKPEQMPAFQGAQERAKAMERAAVGMEEEFAKKGIKAKNMTNLIDEARINLSDASSGYIGTGIATVKGAAGISDKSTQANRKLKLIGGWMVSNVPRMEGPQSDFDVKNYREMAATVGDSTIPIKDRMAALDTLQQLQSKYVGTAPATNIDDLLKKY
jgi:hypothetical protein